MSYKIDPKADRATRQVIAELLKDHNIPPETLDGDGDHLLEKSDVLHFLGKLSDGEWEKFRPIRDRLGIIDPVDTRSLPPAIKQRIAELKIAVDTEIGVPQDSPEYCDRFVPLFHKKGLAQFEDGGLGFGYPFASQLNRNEPELTASEAYAGVLNPQRFPYGSCSEATYKFVSGVDATGTGCRVDAIETETHLFARYKTTDLDPAEIGKIGWEQRLGRAALTSGYYVWSSHQQRSRALREKRLSAAEQLGRTDGYVMGRRADQLVRQGGTKEALRASLRGIELSPQMFASYTSLLGVFNRAKMFRAIEKESLQIAIDGLIAVIKGAKEKDAKAYAVWTLLAIMGQDGETFDAVARAVAEQLPRNGFQKLIEAQQALLKGDNATAFDLLSKAVEEDPQNALAQTLLASAALAQGHIKRAEDAARASLALAPNLPGNYELLSNVALQRGQHAQGYEYAKKASLIMYGYNVLAFQSLANAALAAGDVTNGVLLATMYVKQAPEDPSGWLLLAQALATAGDYDGAVKSAGIGEFYSNLNPQLRENVQWRVYAQSIMAQIALFQSDIAQAEKQIAAISALDPNSPAIPHLAQQLASSRGDLAEALKIAEVNTIAFPEFSMSWSNYSMIALSLNDAQKAEDAVGKALALNPTDPLALFASLMLRFRSGDMKRFDEEFELFSGKYGHLFWFHGVAAQVAFLRGDDDRAMEEARAALRTNPRDFGALEIQGKITVKRGEHVKAEALAARLKELNPFAGSAEFLKAKIHFARGEMAEAEQEARRSLELYPYDTGWHLPSSARNLLALVLVRQGKRAEAQQVREEMEWNRNNPGPHEKYERVRTATATGLK